MPMLSEPKRKQVNILNPRGTSWTNDENKIGQKLMESMGWEKGSGLGKNSQGIQEPIRPSINSGSKGIGYKENSEDWVNNYDAFEDVLASLSSINNPEIADNKNTSSEKSNTKKVHESLEQQSKNSKNRVHYKKFTRCKDLSQYNEDDLACILGSKKSKKRKTSSLEEMEDKGGAASPVTEEVDKFHGPAYINGGSLKDYFSHKMGELKKKREEGILGNGNSNCYENADNTLPDLEFEPMKTDFSFNVSIQEQQNVQESCPALELHNSKKKKKSKKKKASSDNHLETLELQEEERKEEETPVDFMLKKKKKKKQNKDKDLEHATEQNNALTDVPTDSETKSSKRKCRDEDLNVGEEETIKKKKKSKSHKDLPKVCEEELAESEHCEVSGEDAEIQIARRDKKTKKEKKSKKKDTHKGESSEHETHLELDVDESQYELKQNEINESYVVATCKEEKKKKKNKGQCEETPSEKPLNKIIKFASELNLGDLFKGSTSKKSAQEHDEELPSNTETNSETHTNKKSKKYEENETQQASEVTTKSKSKKKKKSDRKSHEDRDTTELERENCCEDVELREAEESGEERKQNEINESYIDATCMEEKKKKKKKRDKVEDNEEDLPEKRLKKIKKFASELSLVNVLKGTSSKKSIQEQGDTQGATGITENNEELENGDSKPKKKLVSKKSFKGLKAEIEEKFRQKGKKKEKINMPTISESVEQPFKSSVKEDQESFKDQIDTFDVCPFTGRASPYEEIFPGSNLAEIKGYDY